MSLVAGQHGLGCVVDVAARSFVLVRWANGRVTYEHAHELVCLDLLPGPADA